MTIAGGASTVGADRKSATDAVIDADLDATYPRCVYKPNDDGERDVALPINMHARVPGAKTAESVVSDAFTGLSNVRWTRIFPDSTAKAWDREEESLVAPTHSFRRPRLGDEWVHAHIWTVDEDRAAIHAHLDVLDLTASHFHRGEYYGDAARQVTEQLLADGWQEHTPYSIDYGLDDAQLEQWGETGDVKVAWPDSSEL
ncbi:hypothetical protein ACLI4Z_13070 [Natrialbaceae archaeon A-arb3/5]